MSRAARAGIAVLVLGGLLALGRTVPPSAADSPVSAHQILLPLVARGADPVPAFVPTCTPTPTPTFPTPTFTATPTLTSVPSAATPTAPSGTVVAGTLTASPAAGGATPTSVATQAPARTPPQVPGPPLRAESDCVIGPTLTPTASPFPTNTPIPVTPAVPPTGTPGIVVSYTTSGTGDQSRGPYFLTQGAALYIIEIQPRQVVTGTEPSFLSGPYQIGLEQWDGSFINAVGGSVTGSELFTSTFVTNVPASDVYRVDLDLPHQEVWRLTIRQPP